MKIKKFTARTEQEAIAKVKAELGLNALILNIRKTKPKGIFSIFRKPITEVTAAYEDKPVKKPEETGVGQLAAAAREAPVIEETDVFKRQRDKIVSLEQKLYAQEQLLNNLTGQLSLNVMSKRSHGARKYDNRLIQVFYDTLVAQEVTPEIAEKVLEDVNAIDDES